MSKIIEDYYGILPTVLLIHDTDPMHLVLHLKPPYDEELTSIVQYLYHCGAEISFDIKEASDYSAVIVNHNDVVNFKGPVFTLRYIFDILCKITLPDISNYRQKATCHIAEKANCMKVVYFKSCKWSSLISNEEKQWILGNASTFNDIDINWYSLRPKYNPIPLHILFSTNDSPQEYDRVVSPTTSEDTRTVQSLGRRTETCSLGKEDEDKTTNEEMNIANSQENISETASTTNNEAFLDDFESDDDEDDEKMQKPPRSTQLEKLVILNNLEPVNENYDEIQEPCSTQPDKHTRKKYSVEERAKILKYIIEHNEYSRIKGREMWMTMERRKVCPYRTWQSLKEHFIKKIICDLDSYDFVSNEQKRMLRRML